MENEVVDLPALELARLTRCRELKPSELVQLHLDRIEVVNPLLGAFLTVAAEQALDAARGMDDSAAGDLPFFGVPISVKDLNDTAGIRTTMGTASFHNRVPTRDTEVVARMKRAGFVILGKTTTPEYGFSTYSEPAGYPPCRNPWDPTRTAGGSSGGAAAAVAAGLCPVAHGGDGGGSIRIPAAVCGVFGLKPSRGRVPWSPGPDSLYAVNGPITGTVADAAALLDVMAGPAPGDLFRVPPPERPFLAETAKPPRRLTVAIVTTPPTADVTLGEEQHAAAEDTAHLLEQLGHRVEKTEFPWDGAAHPHSLAQRLAELLARADLPALDELDTPNRELAATLGQHSLGDVVRSIWEGQAETRRVLPFFDRYDMLLTPTVGVPTPTLGQSSRVEAAGGFAAMLGDFAAIAAYTRPWNVTGQPAVSLPLHMTADGMPIGTQLVGRPAEESTLLRVAAQLEKARPWANRRPPSPN